ncbi:NADPH dehydrogenase NamA [Tepidibacillus marianensis]|uniref:NADPH dehydrogenase NamA n=1 Tax=Tepidibacillus marianensis TaxID=3131995 RepID=UPI0030CBEFB5
MAILFHPTKLKDITIPNRIVMPPMCQYMAEKDGKATNWHKVHYGSRAVGQSGFIILEATAVEARGRITDHDLGLWNDGQTQSLKEIVDFGHAQGSVMGIQLAHAGRKAEIKDTESVIAPSAIPFDERWVTPKEMTEKEIKEVIQAFADAARRADEAGFDLIELHGAHGYMIHEFLSPLSNQRKDEYGESREGRVKFLQETLQAVKAVWPSHKIISLRVSATDYAEDGIDLQEIIEILKLIKGSGVDVIHVSSGGLVPAKINIGIGYQVKFAERIKVEVGLPVIAVGLISEPELVEEILFNERADFVALGRELLRDPYWPLHAAKKLNHDLKWPTPYERAKR